MARFVEGNDDTFVMLLFGFFAFICCLLVLEPLVRQKAYVSEVLATFSWWKSVVGLVTTQPGKVKRGLRILRDNMGYTKTFVFPLAKNILSKWRWACWIITFFLFTMVAYQRLTFDPYDVLGIPPGSDARTIKKAYRSLSMELHPDVNKTEAAAIRYTKVKKAIKILTNPDEEREIMAEEGDIKPGVALPSILTDPNYALYSMTILMIILFAAPLYMLFSLKNKQTFNIIPMMIDVAKYAEMAEPFFDLLGQPRNPLREYEMAERPKLVKLLKKLESAEVFEQPVDELPLKPSEVAEYFHPEICSAAELQQLLLDVIEGNKMAPASETRLRTDLGLFICRENMQTLRSMVNIPPEEEVKALDAYKAKIASKTKDECEYTAVSDEQRGVAIYLLSPLLNTILFSLSRLLPPQEGQRKDPTFMLKNLYTTRLDILATLRKQAEERGDGPITKIYRAEINRAIEQQQACDKAINDIIGEVKTRCKANQRRWKQEFERMQKAEKKTKKPKRP
eukprot:TRINITY_DN434_c0_g1_i1.p1 TRINITY_DN434_c0_g1~~TRINITY_DN434_c0_g1_i1.p1  ORF type:complete len:508 (+),score=168.48 TRINITY_DN434_c0_g1_i1:48-1571(+)